MEEIRRFLRGDMTYKLEAVDTAKIKEGSRVVMLNKDEPRWLGRGDIFDKNTQISRKQIEIKFDGKFVVIQQLGVNPGTVTIDGNPVLMEKGKSYNLKPGDTFTLLLELYKFKVEYTGTSTIDSHVGIPAIGKNNGDFKKIPDKDDEGFSLLQTKNPHPKQMANLASVGENKSVINSPPKKRKFTEDTKVKPNCKWGDQCYRKNPEHFQKYAHPHLSKKPKTEHENFSQKEQKKTTTHRTITTTQATKKTTI